jgi:hypothetical protein
MSVPSTSLVATRVLVADADFDAIELYRASLTGYEVIASADGREALAEGVGPPAVNRHHRTAPEVHRRRCALRHSAP